ncbi:hypothetical protein D3C72_842870 [compost metagenome]
MKDIAVTRAGGAEAFPCHLRTLAQAVVAFHQLGEGRYGCRVCGLNDQALHVEVGGKLFEVCALGQGEHIGNGCFIDPLTPDGFAVGVFLE